MKSNIYKPPESKTDSGVISDKSHIENEWGKLNKGWFFTTIFAFFAIGVLSSAPFADTFSKIALDLLSSIVFLVAGIWWIVLDQFERDIDTPTIFIVGMVLLPILAFPIYCYWSRGGTYGSIQLLKLLLYVAICMSLEFGTTTILNWAIS